MPLKGAVPAPVVQLWSKRDTVCCIRCKGSKVCSVGSRRRVEMDVVINSAAATVPRALGGTAW